MRIGEEKKKRKKVVGTPLVVLRKLFEGVMPLVVCEFFIF